ncbi:MAG TPA: hypothetical protein VFB34_02910 [Chloroflexota bacterium]|nr:hypothetical protein [Chloroflexota bacterium]
MEDRRPQDIAAERFERSAEELEMAARHLRVAGKHMRDREVPRACAHAFAARGHMITASRLMDENAVLHASKSVAAGD